MNIEAQLLIEHSKNNSLKIVDHIGRDPDLVGELVDHFINGSYRINQRASHAVGLLFDKHPDLLEMYLDKIIVNMKNDISVAVKRNTVRMLQDMKIPEKHEGLVMDKCFGYLMSSEETIAVKAFSMTVLSNLAEKYPEICNELKIIIEGLMEFGSPGIKSRGRKILQKLVSIGG